jgi:site-specific recombinase XerD
MLAEINKHWQIFINEQKAKQLAKNSLSTYNTIYEYFYQYLADSFDNQQLATINDINNATLVDYLTQLKLATSSKQLHITVIKQFLWFIADNDIQQHGILKNKVTGVTLKKIDQPVEVFSEIEQQKIKKLIQDLDKTNGLKNNRLSLILKLLLFHGVRISELCNLTWDDVTIEYDDIYGEIYKFSYLGKGQKVRALDFPTLFVQSNLDIIRAKLTSPYVIPSLSGKISTRENIYTTVKIHLNKLGITNVYLHKFRHTFGHNQVNQGVNITTITELMGHSNPNVTFKFYLRGNNKAKRIAIIESLAHL